MDTTNHENTLVTMSPDTTAAAATEHRMARRSLRTCSLVETARHRG